MLRAKRVTLRDLQVVTSHLNFACWVDAPGTAFLSRLCDALKGQRLPLHHTQVSTAMRDDLVTWLGFLELFNGVSFWRRDKFIEADLQVHSDVARGLSFGMYYREKWCSAPRPEDWKQRGVTRDMTFLELLPIVVAVHTSVHFWCDNQAVVCVLKSQTSKSARVMFLVRVFVLQCLRNNTFFLVLHVLGLENNIADSLSRLQGEHFQQLVLKACQNPKPMP